MVMGATLIGKSHNTRSGSMRLITITLTVLSAVVFSAARSKDDTLSAVPAAQAREGFPAFSWDRVPLYAHVGVGSGLKPKQCEWLAKHYNFIALTGGAPDRDFRKNTILLLKILSQKLHEPSKSITQR